MSFQSYAFQNFAFQTFGSGTPSPVVGDTHDGFLAKHTHKFWLRKSIKNPVTQKRTTPKKIIEQYNAIRNETPELPAISYDKLYELMQDKVELEGFLRSLDEAMYQLQIYAANKEDDEFLLAIAAII